MHYYKIIDAEGNVASLLSCNLRLTESETQIEITEAEYNELHALLPEPEEPEPYDDPNLIIDILTGEVE